MTFMVFFPLMTSPFAAERIDAYVRDVHFVQLGVKNGLTSNVNYDVIQDSRGFIWIAGGKGLNRHDAHEIRKFKHDPNRVESLANNRVNIIFEDSSENLWAGTQNGLDLFDRNLESFRHFKHDSRLPQSLSGNIIHALFEDHSGNLWIGSDGGLDRLTISDKGVFQITRQSGVISMSGLGAVYAVAETLDRKLWIGTDNGLYNWHPDSEHRQLFTHNPAQQDSLSYNKIRALYVDKSNTLWVGTQGGGLNRFEPDTKTFKVFRNRSDDPGSISNDNISDIYEDKSGSLWVTTGSGFNRTDKSRNRFIRYKVPYPMSGICEDTANRMWFSTPSGGVFVLDPNQKLFRNYSKQTDGLSSNRVRRIYEDIRGTIWIGTTTGGLNRFDRQTGSFIHYLNDSENLNTLSSNSVPAVYEDDDGFLWLGTWGEGLDRFDPATDRFVNYQHTESFGNDLITWITGGSNGRLWISTFGNGLALFDTKTSVFTHFRHKSNDNYSIAHDQIMSVSQISNGEVWAGTYGKGVSVLNPATERFHHYFHNSDDPGSLSDNTVRYTMEDSHGRIWVLTNFGLNRFDPDKNAFIRYFDKDGLPSNVLFGMVEDGEGMLWITTDKGLARFDPEKKLFQVYDKDDGLPSSFFSYAFGRTRDGHILFGGNDGFTMFNPKEIHDNLITSNVVLTKFELFNQPVPIGEGSPLHASISEISEITLANDQNNMGLYFAALNYTDPQKNRYSFKMEGFDKNWMETDSNRPFAIYSNLDPGQYRFHVRGSNNNRIWNEGTSIKIKILPPWWETYWFRILFLVGIAGFIWAIFQWRLRTVNAHRCQLEFEVKERKQTEAILRESEDRFMGLVSNIPGVIYRSACDKDWTMQFLSDYIEVITGFPPSDFIGNSVRSYESIINSDDTQRVRKTVLAAVEHKNPFEIEYRIVNADRTIRWIFEKGRCVYSNNGQVLWIDGAIFDITDRKQVETELTNYREHLEELVSSRTAELKSSNDKLVYEIAEHNRTAETLLQSQKMEAIGTLAGGIAHDFNNMLSVITGNVSYAVSQIDQEEEIYEVLSDVQDGAKQAQKLTNQLITFAKGGSPIKESTSIKQLIEESAKFVLRGTKVQCDFKFPNDLWTVELDSGQMNQVFTNLILNATQAMPGGGNIQIQAENNIVDSKNDMLLESGRYVKIMVKDQGVGISENNLTNIFNPYFSTKHKERGLGLSTTHSIIKQHGGYISVESQINIGTTFHIYLPSSTESAIQLNEAEKTEIKLDNAHQGHGKILIMDDEESILEMVGRMLNRMGYETIFATDGAQAIEMYRDAYQLQESFDVVILDLTIPGGMGGAETVIELLKIDPNTNAVVSSGYSNDPAMANYQDYGFCDVVPKPYTMTQLSEVLNKIFEDKE